MLHQLFAAMETRKPYGIGAYIAYRHDPLTSLPDAEAVKHALDKLELLVSIDVRYSETGWYSDVILPESTYLERANILAQIARPGAGVRHARPGDRAALRQPPGLVDLPRDPAAHGHRRKRSTSRPSRSCGTTSSRAPASPSPRCARRASSRLAAGPKLTPRDALKFPTPSGKIEIDSALLKKAGLPYLPPYEAKAAPTGDRFNLLFGRPATLAHGQSLNNPILTEIAPRAGAVDPPRPRRAARHRATATRSRSTAAAATSGGSRPR